MIRVMIDFYQGSTRQIDVDPKDHVDNDAMTAPEFASDMLGHNSNVKVLHSADGRRTLIFNLEAVAAIDVSEVELT
jgi:hypothetical protein